MEHGSQLLPTLKKAGLPDALVALLKSESAYSVVVAAGCLSFIGQVQDGGQVIIAACGAIPALVRVMKKTRWPSEPEKQNGLFSRYVLNLPLSGHVKIMRERRGEMLRQSHANLTRAPDPTFIAYARACMDTDKTTRCGLL